MQKSYTRNYFKIYFWLILSFSTQFLSLFIVSPLLTSSPPIYGIYAICVSLTIFLSYTDLGFVGAAFKFASEFYARSKREQEIKVIGFSIWV